MNKLIVILLFGFLFFGCTQNGNNVVWDEEGVVGLENNGSEGQDEGQIDEEPFAGYTCGMNPEVCEGTCPPEQECRVEEICNCFHKGQEDELDENEEQPEQDPEEPEKDPNLVANWNFEGEGTTILDYANNHDGTIVGNAQRTQGKVGNALYFDGIDDYVYFSQNTVDEIGSLTQGTIMFWFKFESLLSTQTIIPMFYIGTNEEGGNDNIYVIEIGHFAGANDYRALGSDPDNTMLYSTWIKNNHEPYLCFDSNENLDENIWYHFAVVVSPEGNTGYLNGIELTNRYYNFGTSSDVSFLNDIPVKEMLTLGYGRSSSELSPDFLYYKGYLDDVRVYDIPLSSSKINELIE